MEAPETEAPLLRTDTVWAPSSMIEDSSDSADDSQPRVRVQEEKQSFTP